MRGGTVKTKTHYSHLYWKTEDFQIFLLFIQKSMEKKDNSWVTVFLGPLELKKQRTKQQNKKQSKTTTTTTKILSKAEVSGIVLMTTTNC